MLGEPTVVGNASSMTSRMKLALTFIVAVCALTSAASNQARAFDGCSIKPASQLTVNVKAKGAKGDGKADDTAAVQRAIDEVAGTGGTVYVPDGIYLISATDPNRLRLGSKMTLRLADRATLKVIPNNAQQYSVLMISQASDVTVVGGMLQGDRKEHQGKKGEWGMGIFIGPEVERVTIAGVTSKEMWGDGFYVSGATDIAFCSVVANHNRRQGLSIIAANRLLVTNSVFRDTRGTRPSAGTDIEPDQSNELVTNVRIESSKFIDNAGGGIIIAGKKGEVAHVEILRNVFEGGRPILVENAPRVRSTAICHNRHTVKETPPTEGFNAFAEEVEVVALQTDCNNGRDLRFQVTRQTKKKKKPKPVN